jgi:putative membrane protein
MTDSILRYLGGVPAFLSYFAIGAGLIVLFCLVYVRLTPHAEFALIKENKPAAAIAFGGALIGFALPLHAAISHAVSLLDCVLWGVVALIVQLFAFFAVRAVISDLPGRIARDERAAGIFSAAVAIAIGLVNSASMSY